MDAAPPTDTFLGPRGFDQARQTLAGWQKLLVLAVLTVLAGVVWFGNPLGVLYWLNIVFAVFFFASTLYRMFLIDVSLIHHGEIQVRADDLEPPGGEWPRYVVQVPLYKEGRSLPRIVERLGKLDYPHDRLTVQLLIEADDDDTRAALKKLTIAPPFVVVDIPVSEPRTKPKACNVGLARAEGDYLVIYDAEDRPEPDQLKKAAVAFSRCPEHVACIQAKLNFYNAHRNLITRCFTAEYAMWFDLCLPGLDHLNAPIPLGGTSNHFRLDALRQLGGWDEFNVTEDCDLGLRLFAAGWRTRMLDSTTWEEACPHPLAWLRQRSRWVKGYVQTYLVHMRRPFHLTRRLGILNSAHFHLLVGGSCLSQLLAPFYWLLVCIWLIWRPPGVGDFFPGPIFITAALCLFIGNFFFVYSCAISCACRGFGDLVKYMPLMVLYWIAMSFAAWRGALQLLWRPHYWEKTQHFDAIQ